MVLSYSIPQKIPTVITARVCIGSAASKWSTSQFLYKIKWLSIDNNLMLPSLKFTHNIIGQKTPELLALIIHCSIPQIQHDTRQSG